MILGSDDGPDTGSGDGGPLGTPGPLPDEAPPSSDQEANEVVSGGGVIGPDDDEGARDAAERSRTD
jgi:hypothetical protein